MVGLHAADASLNETTRRDMAREDALWHDWFDAVAVSEIDTAISDIYESLDVEVEIKQPVCEQSGRCCRFDTYGHRLYVTGLEIARFLRHVPNEPKSSSTSITTGHRLNVLSGNPTQLNGCVYQVEGLCDVHAIRPLGCRIYFCQPGTEAWQQTVYERYMNELRALHEQYDLPYRYMEWRAGLWAAWESGLFNRAK